MRLVDVEVVVVDGGELVVDVTVVKVVVDEVKVVDVVSVDVEEDVDDNVEVVVCVVTVVVVVDE